MRKRILVLITLLLGIFTALALAACGAQSAQEHQSDTPSQEQSESTASNEKQTFTPGTYEAHAQGNNGQVPITVTFSENEIKNIEIGDNKETEGIGKFALDELAKNILEQQSTKVDSISGATFSSAAIKNAVDDAVKQAGGDPKKFNNPVKTNTKKENKELSADLVIVGGGGSGMTAALRAEELGLDVILLEKMPFTGGAFNISGGNQVVMGSKLQKDQGVKDDSAESMIEDFKKNGAEKNIDELISLYANQVGEATDWLNSYVGVEYDLDGGLHKLAEYSHDRELAYKGKAPGAAKILRDKLAKSSVKVLLNTRAMELTTNDKHEVSGVKAESPDANYTITSKAVLLTTGGFGNNKEMLSSDLQKSLYYGPVSSTGDGIKMATAENINAQTRYMEYGKRYPNGIEVAPNIGKSTIAGNIPVLADDAILINKNGKRVVNEKASNRTILETEVQQPDAMLYLLMDQDTFDVFKKSVVAGGISENSIDAWLENNGSKAPQFMKGGTLEELAKTAGIDSSALKNTVETFNNYAKSGKDPEFGRAKDYLHEIGDGPYYLVEQKPRFATTMGGLVVNNKLEVQNKDNKSIVGLYAAGENVGGVMGDDSPSGANNGWAVTSGKLAAESIAHAIK